MNGHGEPRIVVLAGGYGGAKLSHGLALASLARASRGWPPLQLSVIVNTGDDLELHGLAVSPDLDTIMYTLAGLANDETGWGLRDETWSTSTMLTRYGAPTWFRLGDGDMATHIRRSQLLREGRRLTEVTAELATSLDVAARLLPMTDAAVRTEIRTADGWLEFQDYFVRRGQQDRVLDIRHRGIESARPTPEVRAAIASAELIVIAPSNPFVSVGTILAVPEMLDALTAAPATVVAVSPLVGGKALRGPADRMLESLGGRASAGGVVELYERTYPGLVDVFVLDLADAADAANLSPRASIELEQTVMRSYEDRQQLAEAILSAHLPGSGRAARA
ncbi:MAG TPA: 2-phospho-L-lactate transferase [Anaerolineae bacterium]|nr:2-phospho-L-lactate transferase [Anaerolineae bacterium]